MKLKMKKAHLKASMEMLTMEKETAAAIAKADALEAVIGTSEENTAVTFISSVDDTSEHTKEYVENQAKLSGDIQYMWNHMKCTDTAATSCPTFTQCAVRATSQPTKRWPH